MLVHPFSSMPPQASNIFQVGNLNLRFLSCQSDQTNDKVISIFFFFLWWALADCTKLYISTSFQTKFRIFPLWNKLIFYHTFFFPNFFFFHARKLFFLRHCLKFFFPNLSIFRWLSCSQECSVPLRLVSILNYLYHKKITMKRIGENFVLRRLVINC